MARSPVFLLAVCLSCSPIVPADAPTNGKVRAVPNPRLGAYAVVIRGEGIDLDAVLADLERDYRMSVTHRFREAAAKGFLAAMSRSAAESLAADPRLESVTEIPARPDLTGRFRRSSRPFLGTYTAKVNSSAIGLRLPTVPAWQNPNWRADDYQIQQDLQKFGDELRRAYGVTITRVGTLQYVTFTASEGQARRVSDDPRVEFVYEAGIVSFVR